MCRQIGNGSQPPGNGMDPDMVMCAEGTPIVALDSFVVALLRVGS